jgi:tripartite-type tricarboxylate transporter receptor subunit TctC
MLGADAVIREKPDGHTLLVTINSFFTLTPYVTKLTIDPMTEFLPIVETSRNTLVLTGNIAFPPKTLPELVSYVKANPGKVSFASYSPATVSHLAGLMLNDSAGIDMAHVGYKGTGPAQIDLIGGHIPVMVDAMSSALAPVRDGRVRAYAVNSPARHPLAPAVPTFREMGYTDLEVLTAWVGVFASKNTPKEIVSDIAAAIGLALQDEGVRTRMNQLGYFAPNSRSPQELREALQVEGRKLREIVAKKGITLTP